MKEDELRRILDERARRGKEILDKQPPITLEQFTEQAKRIAIRKQIENARTAPIYQERVKRIKLPLDFYDSVLICKCMYRKQITLEMIPKDVLEEFKKSDHYNLLIEKNIIS